MSVGLTYDLSAIDRLNDRIRQLTKMDRHELLERLGETVESQTRRRLSNEKTAPDGSRWQPWSSKYAASRHAGKSLLEGHGDLMDSITYHVSDGEVEIGSNLVYARVHQEGSGDEPVRVPAHQRRVTQAFGKKLSFPVWANVRAFSFLQNIPARPYLGISESDAIELDEVIEDFLREVLP